MILYNQQSRNYLPQQMWKTHAETRPEHDLEMPGRLPQLWPFISYNWL